jgi:hypothetical protein
VLVGKGEADDFEIFFLDEIAQAPRRLLLLIGPQAMACDEGHFVPPSIVIARSEATKQSRLSLRKDSGLLRFARNDGGESFSSTLITPPP